MADFLSRIKVESTVVPGAVATMRRVTVATRALYLESLGKYRTRIRELQRERKPLEDAYAEALRKARAAAKAEADALIEAESITREEAEKRVTVKLDMPDEQYIDLMIGREQEERVRRDSEGRSTLRAALVSIEGITVDGHVPTAEELIEAAPVEFVDELIAAANGIAGLSPTERGESPWPSTSALPVDGPKNDTTAPSADSAQAEAA